MEGLCRGAGDKERRAAPDGIAFGAGVYDNSTRASLAISKHRPAETTDTYRSYLVGIVETNPDRDIWVAPAGNRAVRAIYVDRVFLVHQSLDD